jgi:hypothetical protein
VSTIHSVRCRGTWVRVEGSGIRVSGLGFRGGGERLGFGVEVWVQAVGGPVGAHAARWEGEARAEGQEDSHREARGEVTENLAWDVGVGVRGEGFELEILGCVLWGLGFEV